MFFRVAASVAILACAAHANAEPQPYKPAMMPVLGLSLARRDTNGYQPEQTVCSGEGETCAAACGEGYAECGNIDGSTHCFNPAADQQCCQDGTGNSCEAGYYCTHDNKDETFCCPDNMDLAACAAAYSVTGKLEIPEVTTSSAAPTTTSVETTSAPVPTTTSEPTSSIVITTSTSQHNTTSVHKTTQSESTAFTVSSGTTSAWTGTNSTITSAAPTQPQESAPADVTSEPSSPPGNSGAAATGISAMLVLAAGIAALL